MMSPFGVLAGVCWVLLIIVDIVLVLLAFQTSFGFGLATFVVPFYAVTSGNWRLKTTRKRTLALIWWVLFIGAIASLMLAR